MDSGRPGSTAGARTRPRRIAVLTDALGHWYIDTILDEVVDGAAADGMDVICFVDALREFPARRQLVTDAIGEACVDAILVVSLGNDVGAPDIAAYCAQCGTVPMCTTTVPWIHYPRVLIDNEPGLRDGIRHLIEVHGRRKIAFVRGSEVNGEAELRYRVYREVLSEHGFAFDPTLVSRPGSYITEDGVSAVRTWLEELSIAFDAVARVNDGTAIGVMQELSARGIASPTRWPCWASTMTSRFAPLSTRR